MQYELIDVGYRYADGTPALSSLNLEIPTAARLAVLGANGSGKSTLLRLLSGLYMTSSGALRFEGSVVSEESMKDAAFRHEFRQSVGFVFQQADAQLFNATVFDETAFGPRQLGLEEVDVQARVFETLDFLGIGHLVDRAPFRLSGGEKRKVALASVLSMNPRVLLLDEPFLGLDPRSQSWLITTLQQLQAVGKTTIVATHTLETVPRIADTAIVLGEDHRLRAMGPVSEILANQELLVASNLCEEIPVAA